MWQLVEQYAFEALRAGRKRVGIGAVWERIRWHVDVERDPSEHFKLNNSFRAYYSRRWQYEHPEHAGLFETRRLRSRAWIT